jgi:hypothetical protein
MEAVSLLPVYAFLARAAPRDNPEKYGWVAARVLTLSPMTRAPLRGMEKPLKRCFPGEALGDF